MSRLAFDGIPLSFHSGLHKVFLQCFLCYNLPVNSSLKPFISIYYCINEGHEIIVLYRYCFIQKCALGIIFPYVVTTGERHYCLIFLMALFATLTISAQVFSHPKLITIDSFAVRGSSTCQCAKRSALKKSFIVSHNLLTM